MLGIALSTSYVQTKIAQYITQTLNTDFGVDISISKAKINVFGGVKLGDVLIKDHHKKAMISSKIVNTTILDVKKLIEGDLLFGDIKLERVLFNLTTYKNEEDTNIDVFIKSFEDDKPSSGKHTTFIADKAAIIDGHFVLVDENREVPKDLDLTKLNATLEKFDLYGPDLTMVVKTLSFLDHRGLYVSNLSTDFSYTKKQMKLQNLDITTRESKIKADLFLNYKISDFAKFNDKVKFNGTIYSSLIASNDIRHFYNELGKDLFFNLETKVKGTLNNLTLNNLKLFDKNDTRIFGAIKFKNIFGKEHQYFYMDANLSKASSSYSNLVTVLPNVLGKKLPIELKRIGKFNLVGNVQLTAKALDADFSLTSEIGKIKSVLSMDNIDFIDKASYVGNVKSEDFDIGKLFEEKDLGKITSDLEVEGIGFTEKYLNTGVRGSVSKLTYNNYTYRNLSLNGKFKLPYYKGKLIVNDPNLKMDFEGLVDLSKKDSKYDFHIDVANADLYKLNLVKDTTSIFKGDVVVQVDGNTIENLNGNIYIKNTSYQNSKDIYAFDDFMISSSFDGDKVRTITLNSPDIVQGEIVGKFRFEELPSLIRNSLGSLYTNFEPEKVNKGQFLKFNFTIYNKIVEIFYPDIAIGTNTVLKGNIKSDSKEFKLNFNSPKIVASDNTFDNIRVAVDNKNPLYNAFLELDSIKTKYYKIRDFSLINVTVKDTLFFRSEFKGGSKGEDYFNLNLYHTINKNNENVVGISKSELKFKDYLWYLNENETSENKIVFDKLFKNFTLDNFVLSHKNQEIALKGKLSGTTNKDLKLSFKDVDLFKITPADDKFVFNGNLNGEINFLQNNAVYKPTASLAVDHLNINNTDLGVLKLNIEGDHNLEKFTIDSFLENKNLESFNAKGSFKIVEKEALLDLDLKLDKFNLGILSSLGGEVLSNIRGFVTGNSRVEGTVNKPKISGRLFVDDAGMTIPYLNVDYELANRSIVDLIDNQFLFRNNTITDSKFGTKGILKGSIEHNKFLDWKLNLGVNTNRLLVLNTVDSEDAAYYGTAYIDGSATISGPTNGLFIKVEARSQKGSALKIPINEAESIGDNSLIHFISEKEKNNIKKGIIGNDRNYKGLELEFDLDITPDAEVEVILDRNSGHGMKGKGYGSLLFKINTLGKFNMWGNFQAYEGTYNFKYGGLIDKKFDVKKGGSISWEGNPMRAQLNLEAVYKTIANPAVLLDNSSFNRKVPVEVVIGIKGDLASPEPDFNIEFPTVSNVLKSEIQYKLNDKDVRQTQALYLLSSGGFLSSEGVTQSDFSGSLFETASSLIGGILKTDNDKIRVGLNYVSADRRLGKETDGRVVATISSKINERFTINGKVGVPFGGINESAIVGDLEVQYRVNEDGTLNLRLFNRENDINYIGQGIGYTQGLGVTYEVDFDTFKELINKIFKNVKLAPAVRYIDQFQDSNLAPEYINFSKQSEPKPDKPKSNFEGIIPEEE
ncbi:translocation/assembly module TamB domain-containing protein [Flavobacterium sp. NG2]|uniref:translocation/assembly module TamB domain-containing protein n=1 Tax=Flavobacterium sp. NG2 TaxID=3097547 RepID=UPI002A7F9E34|nr:translocation/assembly module TamB domain-containing protein [Flavobacterium sp. NG2]WPR70813.1 translocation/assembly module TamB domain-containing protein [Flavobacterium sp. NG2]